MFVISVNKRVFTKLLAFIASVVKGLQYRYMYFFELCLSLLTCALISFQRELNNQLNKWVSSNIHEYFFSIRHLQSYLPLLAGMFKIYCLDEVKTYRLYTNMIYIWCLLQSEQVLFLTTLIIRLFFYEQCSNARYELMVLFFNYWDPTAASAIHHPQREDSLTTKESFFGVIC